MMQITKCKPRKDKVLVDLNTMSDRTEGGLYIPEQAKDKASNFGKVLATGPDVEGIRRGDVIVFGKYAGTKVKDMDGEYLILPDEDILLHIEQVDFGFTVEFDIATKLPPVTTYEGLDAAIEASGESSEYIFALGVTMKSEGVFVAATGEGIGTLDQLLKGELETGGF